MNNKLLITILFLFLGMTVAGQAIKKLESELSAGYSSSEYEYARIATAIKLQKLDPFNEMAIEYICRYYKDKKLDSIGVFFDKLIADHPHSSIPYITRSDFLNFEVDFNNKNEYIKGKEKYLKCALSIDPNQKYAIYRLAEVYYNDFIYPLKIERDYYDFLMIEDEEYRDTGSQEAVREEMKKSVLEHPADSALKYFYKLWSVDREQRGVIYFPIRQLECCLGVSDQSPIAIEKEELKGNCYFPTWYFANLKDG